MLVSGLRLLRALPCLAEPGKLIVIGESDEPLDGVLPLLNAILPNAISYNPMAGAMTLRRQPGLITIYPHQVMITQVNDVEDGLAMLAATRDLLNRVWDRRDEIQPKLEGLRVPRPLDVYELLPALQLWRLWRGDLHGICLRAAGGAAPARGVCRPGRAPGSHAATGRGRFAVRSGGQPKYAKPAWPGLTARGSYNRRRGCGTANLGALRSTLRAGRI